jgi:hypothetical protein
MRPIRASFSKAGVGCPATQHVFLGVSQGFGRFPRLEVFDLTRFLQQTEFHPRAKPENMLRSKTL